MVKAWAEHRRRRLGRSHIGGARPPWRVLFGWARAKQAEGRRARRRCDMHQAGVVADKHAAAPQHRGNTWKIELADEIDPPVLGQRRQQRLGLWPLMTRR